MSKCKNGAGGRICVAQQRHALIRLNAVWARLETKVTRRNVRAVMKACRDWLEHDPHRDLDSELSR